MDQTKLENQLEMVHLARMGPPSCWIDQKVSQSLPRLGNILGQLVGEALAKGTVLTDIIEPVEN